jgi:hypothetical protein
MKEFILITLMTAGLIGGCCQEDPRVEPPLPTPNRITGWRYTEDEGVRSLGHFLLRKNEATDNGKVRVKVLDVVPGDPCVDPQEYQRLPSAKFQFVRVFDGEVLCEVSEAEKSSSTLGAGSSSSCGNKLAESGILGLYISAINLKEGWVFFELRG